MAVAVVRTHVHEVPSIHAAATVVLSVIEIRIAQAVAELVAHRADALDGVAATEFAAAGIGVDLHAVEAQRARAVAVIAGRLQIPLVGPDGVGHVAIGFAVAGIDDIDLIDLAVAVPIIVGIVHVVIGQLHSLDDHFSRMKVVAVAVVASVVGLSARHGVRTGNVEGQVKEAHALGVEVVVNRTHEAALLEVLFVGDAVVECGIVGGLEAQVAEVHQNDQALLVADVVSKFSHGTPLWSQSLAAALVRLRPSGLCPHDDGGAVGFFKDVLHGTHSEDAPVGTLPVMAVFVADENGLDLLSTSQCQHAFQPRLGRNSHCCRCQHQQGC